MKYQKKEIFFSFVRSIIFTVTTGLMVYGACWVLLDKVNVLSVFFAILALGCVVVTGLFWRGGFILISQYRYAKETDVLNNLVGVNKYATDEEMRKAFEEQRAHCLYSDDRLTLTEEFLADAEENVLFFINGVLDAETTVYRTNGVIEKVELSIIYFDGERYKMVYRRSWVSGSMKERAEKLLTITKYIARRSPNFRRHLPPAKTKH